MSTKINFQGKVLSKSEKILIVVSRFNSDITEKLLKGTEKRLLELGIHQADIDVIIVPGAIEIPVVTSLMASQNKHAAIICLGAVIRGETSHYDYVCGQVSDGCARISLETKKPIVFGILTTENEAQAYERLGGNHGHKGYEFAETTIEMIQVINALRQ
ncbi:6,7-dimethyl-8-ribityllumazine synthase [Candidatus Paracaedibacter symbiosus]|uniref:6,7-dimethyl-8-ribityllumazine synthase n=1 Tax=Candidatus Paracaedibacter symbiosus TaxID=244582 RepID=UPI000509F465|nr:6,7-dimethyl-8-ribityllumazine synthase [Candidatus Paracaedibacter symbiosus]